jgi:hypothetical protein
MRNSAAEYAGSNGPSMNVVPGSGSPMMWSGAASTVAVARETTGI